MIPAVPHGDSMTLLTTLSWSKPTFVGWGGTTAQWVRVEFTNDTKQKIAVVSAILDTILVQVKGANRTADEVLTDIERAQLVAVLETVLQVLKAPMVEKSLLTKAQEALTRVTSRTAEKQAEQGLGKATGEGARMLLDLIKSLF